MAVLSSVLVTVIALGVAAFLRAHHEAPKITTGLFFLAGIALGGVVGNGLAELIDRIAAHNASTGHAGAGSLTWAITRVVLSLATIGACAIVVIKGMWRGRAQPRRYHHWLALTVPTLAIAIGVPGLAPLLDGLSGGLTNAGAAMVEMAREPTTASQHHPTSTDHVMVVRDTSRQRGETR